MSKRLLVWVGILSSCAADAIRSELAGDLALWDSIFASRAPALVLDASAHHLAWTEGPVLSGGESSLAFSDPQKNQLYGLDLASNELEILFENSGNADVEELAWRAEPGSNGLTLPTTADPGDGNRDGGNWILACQHGARRLALLNLKTRERIPFAERAANGRRLNGPNDLIVNDEPEGTFVYFTDPVYAWLERDRFEDLPYLDERVKTEGPGFCGVYRTRLVLPHEDDWSRPREVEFVAKMDRPNGVGFLPDSDTLVVSECCQGQHNERCEQGTSWWNLYRRTSSGDDRREEAWNLVESIENDVPAPSFGCADGFEPTSGPDGNSLLIASCANGLCLVDVRRGRVAARLITAFAPGRDGEDAGGGHAGCKISNVAIGNDRIFMTGDCGILTLPLRQKDSGGSATAIAPDEL
ncbi:hypothetical protein ACHAWF_007686 [Thalassiosira exigua]